LVAECLTLETSSISYGSHIFGAVAFVTAIKYSIHAIIKYPTATVIILFNLRSRLHCFRFCPWIRSSSAGLKSDFIRGALFSISTVYKPSQFKDMRGEALPLTGWSKEYDRGSVTRAEMVMMK